MSNRNNKDASSNIGVLLLLHLLLLFYSLAGVCSKFASGNPLMSWKFVLLYGGSVAILGVYAIGWQQVIKRIPLTLAYVNKAITLIWSLVWGVVIFHEDLTPHKVIAALVVLAGIMLFVSDPADAADQEEAAHE